MGLVGEVMISEWICHWEEARGSKLSKFGPCSIVAPHMGPAICGSHPPSASSNFVILFIYLFFWGFCPVIYYSLLPNKKQLYMRIFCALEELAASLYSNNPSKKTLDKILA